MINKENTKVQSVEEVVKLRLGPLISKQVARSRGNHPPMCQTYGDPEEGVPSVVFGVTFLVQQRRALKCIEQREVRNLLKGPQFNSKSQPQGQP